MEDYAVYRKASTGWIKHIDFEIFDLISMEIAFLFAYYLRHKDQLSLKWDMYQKLVVLLALFDIASILFTKNYNGIVQRRKGAELIATIKHVSVVNALLLGYEFMIKESESVSRYVFIVSWALGIVLCYGSRIIWKRVIRIRMTSPKNQAKMLVISSTNGIDKTIKYLYEKTYRDFAICAIAIHGQAESDMQEYNGIPVIYGQHEFYEYVRTNVVDRVYIDNIGDKKKLADLTDLLLSMGITVHIGLGFLPDNLPNEFMESFGGVNAVTSTIKTTRGWEVMVKRLMDICGALVGLVFCGIAYLFVAPIIKKASPGPVFFAQERVGTNGRIFKFYKFRSMYLDAEDRLKDLMANNEMSGFMFKMENDPRIIGSEKGPGKGIGNFIRKTSIDELPQFWNILKGDMSLVGTRPPTKREYEQYDLHHKIRLSMKPGLTGMWQATGRSDITDFEEVVRLDTMYIENWSLGLDIKLIFKTFVAVLKKEGSK